MQTCNHKQHPSICLFTALYAPSMGGVETYTHNLAAALSDMGCRVTVVTMNTHSAAPSEVQGNIEIVRLPCHSMLGGRYPVSKHNKAYRRTMERLAKKPLDYVVVNTRFYPLSLEGLKFARQRGITPVLIEHGSAHLSMGSTAINYVVESVEHTMTVLDKRQQPVCYAVSKKASAWLGHFGIESAGELPNAIDADAYAARASNRAFRDELGINPNALLVASAGRLVPEKGVTQLAQAAGQLARESRNIHVIMAGAGPLEAELTAAATPNLHLVGKLDKHDLAALYQQADVYCLPSRSEGFATTLLESAACGTSAIVTNVGGTDELIPSERFGTIISNMEPDTIAAALRQAADDRPALQAQGHAAATRVREICSWQQTAERTLKACEDANFR